MNVDEDISVVEKPLSAQIIRQSLRSSQDREALVGLEVQNPWNSVFLYVKTYAAILIAACVSMLVDNPFLTAFSILFIAGRQHSLYILNHDASHGTMFHSKMTNKYVAMLLSNVVMFHHPEAWSFVQWRRVHLKHHGQLFTEGDPNYIGRDKAGDTHSRLTPWQLLWGCLRAVPDAVIAFLFGQQEILPQKDVESSSTTRRHLSALFVPFRNDPEMEKERILKCLSFPLLLFGFYCLNLLGPYLLFWIVPMYTVYPMILRFHDLTEHYWEVDSVDIVANSRSVTLGWTARFILSFLPRGLHREHHLFPRVAVNKLPALSGLLGAHTRLSRPLRGLRCLWNDLFPTADRQ